METKKSKSSVSSNKRFCSCCGSAIDTNANFCRYCGEKRNGMATSNTLKICPFCKTKISVDCEECPNCQRLLVEKISSNNQSVSEHQKHHHRIGIGLFQRIIKFFIERVIYSKLLKHSVILLGIIFVILIFSSDEYSYDSGSTKAPLPPPIKQISNDSVEIVPLSPAVSLSNGTILKKNNIYLQEDGELQIKNGTDLDAVIKLICDGTSVLTVYVKANNTYTMRNISDGIYWLVFAQGLDWDSVTKKFKRNTQYSAFEDTFDFTTTYNQYTVFEITLNPVIGGTAETSDIQGNQFDQY